MSKLKYTLLLFQLFIIALPSAAQTPGGINYQGIARDQYRIALNNKTITLRFTIRENTVTGPTLYTETRDAKTDSFGVFNLEIGGVGATVQSGNIKQVAWSNPSKKFLQVELDIKEFPSTGLLNMGTTELLSVPFSFYSDFSKESDSTRISDTTRASDTSRVAGRADKADVAIYSKSSGTHFFSAMVDPFGAMPIPTSGSTAYPTYNIPVKFPVVLANEENKYDPATGEFTAPDDGYYQFGVTIEQSMIKLSGTPEDFAYLIYAFCKNGKVIKALGYHYQSIDEEGNIEGIGFNSTINESGIYHLLKGDKVGLKLTNNFNTPVFFGLSLTTADLAFVNATYEPQAFMKFSGYKIK